MSFDKSIIDLWFKRWSYGQFHTNLYNTRLRLFHDYTPAHDSDSVHHGSTVSDCQAK